mmetsp:Transcript_68076/g.197256  ORF Transcript_68076/g.197256 Transcript_68076/m.197256 type:complete len:302 (-) Transcript_68076:153-1058(-)
MLLKRVLDYRLEVHEEVQGWILLFATVTAIFLFCLPCYCAGLSCTPARKFAQWLGRRLPSFYLFMAGFNFVFMYLVVTWMPDWTFAQYVKTLAKTVASCLKHLLDGASSIAIIAAFCFALAFKDRIAQLFGFDHKTLFRCKVRDCFMCFGERFRPIELGIWKVEDLQSADPFTANNVFIEFFLGYNEPTSTRVHNNAGSGCLIKQVVQLNFDADDDEEVLFIFVKNQKVMGTSVLGRAEITAEKLAEMVRCGRFAGQGGVRWSPEFFPEPISLMPRGKLWLRAAPLDEEGGESLLQELTTC